MSTPSGVCECGCGQRTARVRQNNPALGWVLGEPRRFVVGHNNRLRQPKAGGRIDGNGYVVMAVKGRDHPDISTAVNEHVLLAERALGHRLPSQAEVHHVNGDRADNSRGNLVICQDTAYHRLLHVRTAALKASGHAHWRKCWKCQRWDDPASLKVTPKYTVHPACRLAHERAYKASRKVPA